MYTATAGIVLPTTIIGSLPRPSWYTQNLGRREFREAMIDRAYREQYLDAVSTYLRDQEVAGLDIVTDGDCRFDADVAGHNWFSYAPLRMSGFSGAAFYKAGGKAGEVRHDHARADRHGGARSALQGSEEGDPRDQRRAQRGAARARRRRLQGDPDGGAADPSARLQGPRRRGVERGVHGRGVQ